MSTSTRGKKNNRGGDDEDPVLVSTLNLVDLAGSECINATGGDYPCAQRPERGQDEHFIARVEEGLAGGREPRGGPRGDLNVLQRDPNSRTAHELLADGL